MKFIDKCVLHHTSLIGKFQNKKKNIHFKAFVLYSLIISSCSLLLTFRNKEGRVDQFLEKNLNFNSQFVQLTTSNG